MSDPQLGKSSGPGTEYMFSFFKKEKIRLIWTWTGSRAKPPTKRKDITWERIMSSKKDVFRPSRNDTDILCPRNRNWFFFFTTDWGRVPPPPIRRRGFRFCALFQQEVRNVCIYTKLVCLMLWCYVVMLLWCYDVMMLWCYGLEILRYVTRCFAFFRILWNSKNDAVISTAGVNYYFLLVLLVINSLFLP